jgi:hypothetical protein
MSTQKTHQIPNRKENLMSAKSTEAIWVAQQLAALAVRCETVPAAVDEEERKGARWSVVEASRELVKYCDELDFSLRDRPAAAPSDEIHEDDVSF